MLDSFPPEAVEEITALKEAFLELAHARKEQTDTIWELETKVRQLEARLSERKGNDGEWRTIQLDKKGD